MDGKILGFILKLSNNLNNSLFFVTLYIIIHFI